MWTFSKQLTEYSVTRVLLWLAVAGAVLSLPNIGLFFGIHHWTEKFGFGARAIAVIDAAAASPFAQLSMIPLLTLIAFYAPEGRRATWFALMASLMNLALVAGQLQTKYLNHIFVIQRGEYSELGPLLITAAVLGFILPIGAIFSVWSARVIKAGIAQGRWRVGIWRARNYGRVAPVKDRGWFACHRMSG